MGKTPSLGVRVQPETKAALEKAAKDDLRSVSSLIEKILVGWLRARGYLPNDGGPSVRLTKAAKT
jgi:hypothetical protein